ncbi:hypothetical protein ILUMI_15073, partial [Ignelater luminosus]
KLDKENRKYIPVEMNEQKIGPAYKIERHRQSALVFHLKQNNIRKRVYKNMFLETLRIGEWSDYSIIDTYLSIRPGKRADDSTVTDLRCLAYHSDGFVEYTVHYEDDWKRLPQ